MKKFLKDLFVCNAVVFKIGGWFTKFFMITIWPFCATMIFVDTSGEGSLISQGGSAWVMIIFIMAFGLLYPVRNYWEVKRILKGTKGDLQLQNDYKHVLDAYAKASGK